MAKWFGKIGYAATTETSPGVWEDVITEHEAFGDSVRNMRRLVSSEKVNDNIKINEELSIIADAYAISNFHNIRYVTYMGTKWKVDSVDASQYPRLVLTMGEVYNE
jgi:hypothetical protein